MNGYFRSVIESRRQGVCDVIEILDRRDEELFGHFELASQLIDQPEMGVRNGEPSFELGLGAGPEVDSQLPQRLIRRGAILERQLRVAEIAL